MTLRAVSTRAVKTLADGLRSGRLAWPLSSFTLQVEGLADLAPSLKALGPLGREAVLALLDAVLAERLAGPSFTAVV